MEFPTHITKLILVLFDKTASFMKATKYRHEELLQVP